MTKTTTILSLLGLIVLLGAAWVYTNYVKYAPTTYITETKTPGSASSTVTTTDTTTGQTTPGAPTYTMAQVAAHNSETSCYSVISGVVYDLTMWINMHPGGPDKILGLCGKDGTAPFMNQHHGAKRQMDILARFKIGLLAQ